ncbi:MAG: alpha/beta hydrolase [Candidatus Eremiobacteraeota bacterium]|nr:alpha/beta hydrolase [Candidatus Eremiobacteraeota bacterium]
MPTFRASDGAGLAYEERGSRSPAMLFVHGWQGDGSLWRELIQALPADVRTLAVDLRGSGESREAAGPYTIERFCADLRELVESRGGGPVVVVGHSMGGTVALRFALDAPELTAGLVLVAPVPASGGGYSPKGEAYLRATAGDPAAAKAWLARTLTQPDRGITLERVCTAASRTDPSAALQSFDSWAHADFAEATRGIQAPVLVIAPEHDSPQVHQERVAALLPNVRYELLPNSAHYAIVENAQEIAALIAGFIVS